MTNKTKGETFKPASEGISEETNGYLETRGDHWGADIASPMVPVKESGGATGYIRWAIDYRALNNVTGKLDFSQFQVF